MADGGGRSSGSSLQGEHEIKSTTRKQSSEKSEFHNTVKLIFSMKPVSEDPWNYLTLLIPKIFVAPNVFPSYS